MKKFLIAMALVLICSEANAKECKLFRFRKQNTACTSNRTVSCPVQVGQTYQAVSVSPVVSQNVYYPSTTAPVVSSCASGRCPTR